MAMRKTSKYKAILIMLLIQSLLFLSASTALAAQEEQTLTLQQAIDKSYKSSLTLSAAKKSLDLAEIQQEQTISQMSLSTLTASKVESAQKASLNYQVASKTYDQTKEKVAYDTTKKYFAVQQALADLELAKLAFQKASQDIGIARITAGVGLSTNASVMSTDSAYTQAKTNLESAENTLKNAYSLFNDAVGLNMADRPVLNEAVPEFRNMNLSDVNVEISQAVTSNTDVWKAQMNALIAENNANMVLYTGEYYPYQQQEITVKQAQLTVQSTETQVAQSIEQMFYQVKNMEEAYKTGIKSRNALAEALRVKKLMYDVGVAIKNDVTAAELSLATAENALDDTRYSHSLLAIAFEKPWVL